MISSFDCRIFVFNAPIVGRWRSFGDFWILLKTDLPPTKSRIYHASDASDAGLDAARDALDAARVAARAALERGTA